MQRIQHKKKKITVTTLFQLAMTVISVNLHQENLDSFFFFLESSISALVYGIIKYGRDYLLQEYSGTVGASAL